MTRSLNAGMTTALEASEGYADVWLLEIISSGGTTRFNSTTQDVLYNSNTYTAVGGAFEFEPPAETPDLSGQGLRMTLSGVTQTVISDLLNNHMRGRNCTLYFAQVNLSTGAVADAPIEVFTGMLNEPWEITEQWEDAGSGTVKITTTAVSGLARHLVRRPIRTNVLSHNDMLDRASVVTGDTFFKRVPELIGKTVMWGKSVSTVGTIRPPSTDGGDSDHGVIPPDE